MKKEQLKYLDLNTENATLRPIYHGACTTKKFTMLKYISVYKDFQTWLLIG